MRLIKTRGFEAALEKARDELGQRLDAFTPLFDRIFIDFGIPMEYATKNWESFMRGLDQLLQEHFTYEPDKEDE